jgi:iron(III) transport system substrate-binding protein
MKLTATITASATAAILLLAGCSTSAPAAAPSGTPADSLEGSEIVVYNAQHEELTQAWADEFSDQTGVTVTLRSASDTELANQLVAEGDASPADVFLTENSPGMALVENAGLLADVDEATLDLLPAQYRPSTGKWTGIAARSTVFAYNPALLTEGQLPGSLLDLAKPEWKGRWAASPSGADFQAIVAAVLELEGASATTEWLTGMRENFTEYKGNSTVMKAVNAGEIPGGVIYHYYWFGDQASTQENSSHTKLHYFKSEDPGAFVSISGGGVLESSDNQAAAQAFLAYIVGKDGQEVLRTGTSFEYPVSDGTEPHEDLPSLASLEAPEIDPARLNSSQVTDLMTKVGLI